MHMMKKITLPIVLGCALLMTACGGSETQNNDSTTGNDSTTVEAAPDTLRYPDEKHLKNVRQLTFGGNNAEAYFSYDDKYLVFQSDYSKWDAKCDQIFYMPVSGHGDQPPKRLSTGLGRTTCSYFLEGNQQIIYASTHLGADTCPPQPPRSVEGHYVWPIYETFDIFTADLEGNIVQQLTDTPGYDAEATLSPDGKRVVFTSMRSGDLELYTMNPDGSDVQQITNTLGYDGGAFFSPDGSKLVWRASRPTADEDVKVYKDLLAQGLVKPTNMELFVANADGSDARQVTELGKANWGPFFHPSGEKIIFASNHKSERGRKFNLFMINVDGTGLEQITHDDVFDAFPMFSYDGKYLVFSSNRFNDGGRDTNVFLAEWVE